MALFNPTPPVISPSAAPVLRPGAGRIVGWQARAPSAAQKAPVVASAPVLPLHTWKGNIQLPGKENAQPVAWQPHQAKQFGNTRSVLGTRRASQAVLAELPFGSHNAADRCLVDTENPAKAESASQLLGAQRLDSAPSFALDPRVDSQRNVCAPPPDELELLSDSKLVSQDSDLAPIQPGSFARDALPASEHLVYALDASAAAFSLLDSQPLDSFAALTPETPGGNFPSPPIATATHPTPPTSSGGSCEGSGVTRRRLALETLSRGNQHSADCSDLRGRQASKLDLCYEDSVVAAPSVAASDSRVVWQEASRTLEQDLALAAGKRALSAEKLGPEQCWEANETSTTGFQGSSKGTRPVRGRDDAHHQGSRRSARQHWGGEGDLGSGLVKKRAASTERSREDAFAAPLRRCGSSCDAPRFRPGCIGSLKQAAGLGSTSALSSFAQSRSSSAFASRSQAYLAQSCSPRSWTSSLRDGCSPRAGGGALTRSGNTSAERSFAGAPVSWGGEQRLGQMPASRSCSTDRRNRQLSYPVALPQEPLWRPPSRWRVSAHEVTREWEHSLCGQKKKEDRRQQSSRPSSRSSSPGSRIPSVSRLSCAGRGLRGGTHKAPTSTGTRAFFRSPYLAAFVEAMNANHLEDAEESLLTIDEQSQNTYEMDSMVMSGLRLSEVVGREVEIRTRVQESEPSPTPSPLFGSFQTLPPSSARAAPTPGGQVAVMPHGHQRCCQMPVPALSARTASPSSSVRSPPGAIARLVPSTVVRPQATNAAP